MSTYIRIYPSIHIHITNYIAPSFHLIKMDFIKDMVSGFIGGVCCTFAGLPLDLVKVRQQTIFKNKSLSGYNISLCCTNNQQKKRLSQILPNKELEDLGFALAVRPITLLSAAIKAMQDVLVLLKNEEDTVPKLLPSFAELKTVVGFDQYFEEDAKYAV